MQLSVYSTLSEAEYHWRNLEDKSISLYVYQSFDWVKATFETLGRAMGQHPLILATQSTLLPLATRNKHHIRILEFLSTDINGYNAPLQTFCAAPTELDVLFAEALRIARPDVIQIDHQPPRMADETPNYFLEVPKKHEFIQSSHLATLNSEYFARRGHHRYFKETYRRRRSLQKQMDFRFGVAHPELFSITQKQRDIKYDARQKHPFRDAYEAAYKAILTLPCAHYTALWDGAVPLATNLGLLFRDRLCGVTMSYDHEHPLTHLGPGRVLLLCLVEDLIKRGCRVLDMSVGDIDYKRYWADYRMPLYHSRYAVSLKGRIGTTIRDRFFPLQITRTMESP